MDPEGAQEPLVSVVIPAFNAAATIRRALASVARQDYDPMETIVVDDGSTDDTRRIVAATREPPVRLIELGRNRGPSAARNAGIKAARGKYVAFLDADDEWLANKLAKQVAAIEAAPAASFATCDGVILGPNGREWGRLLVERPRECGPEAWKTLLEYTFVQTSGVVARRDLLVDLGGFDEERVMAEDQDMWIRLALAGEVLCVDEVLMIFHRTSESLSSRLRRGEAEYVLPMIERHIRRQRARLSRSEIRRALGGRLSQIGRNLYGSGEYAKGVRLILRATLMGREPLANLAFLVHATPFGRRLKDLIRG